MMSEVVFWQPSDEAPLFSFEDRVWVTNHDEIWMAWRDEEGWHDCAEYAGDNKSMAGQSFRPNHKPRQPILWQKRIPENYVPLPEEIDDAGKQLIEAVDEDKLPVQGAMWVLKEGKWEYLLVTSDVELLQERLPDIFQTGRISQAMVPDDVKIVGPNNHTFQLLVKFSKVNKGGRAEYRGNECRGSHSADDGTLLKYWFRPNAVIYRALKTIDGSDFNRPKPKQTLP